MQPGESVNGREVSPWTEPLQAAVAAFLVVSAVVNLVLVFAFADVYRNYYAQVYQRAGLPGDQLGSSVEGSVTVISAITVAVAIVYLALAGLSFFRRFRWTFIVDMIVLFAAGAPSLVGGVLNLVSPSSAALPQAFGLTQLVLALVAMSLSALMLGLSLRHGAWAQRSPAATAV